MIWILEWNNAIALLQDFLFAHGDLILEGWWVPWTLHCCLNLICVRCGFDLIECRCEGRLPWNGSIIDIIICYCMYLSINILRSFKLNLCLHGSLNCSASLNLFDQIILSSPCRWMNINIFRQYVVQSTFQQTLQILWNTIQEPNQIHIEPGFCLDSPEVLSLACSSLHHLPLLTRDRSFPCFSRSEIKVEKRKCLSLTSFTWR